MISTAIVADHPDPGATLTLGQIAARAHQAHHIVRYIPWTTVDGVTLQAARCQCGLVGHREATQALAEEDLWGHFDNVDLTFTAKFHRRTPGR